MWPTARLDTGHRIVTSRQVTMVGPECPVCLPKTRMRATARPAGPSLKGHGPGHLELEASIGQCAGVGEGLC